MKPASHDIIFRIRPGGFSSTFASELFTQYQLIAPVTVNVFHLIYHIFYHIDAQSADLPFLAGEQNIRVGLCEWVVGRSAVNVGISVQLVSESHG